MDNLKFKGQIEVILLDENGNVKHREVQDNAITTPALKHMLYLMMAGTGLNNITRATNGGSAPSITYPSQYGLYVMSAPVNIDKKTFLPPYVDATRNGLHPSVSFYNANGDTAETVNVIISSSVKCCFNKNAEVEFSIEYVKNSGTGIVRSVVIGRNHGNKSYKFLFAVRDVDLPADLYSKTVNYLLEHTTDGTILHKTASDNLSRIWINLKTKVFGTAAYETAVASITNYYGGLVMNNMIFKVAKQGASGATYTARLTIVKNWTTSAPAASTLDIAFTTRTGMSINTSVTPVLVAKPGQNKIELFVTTSMGNHSGTFGANVQKAVIDVSNPDNITYTIVDCGIIPYAISGSTGTTVALYVTGLFHDNKYYLPYYYAIDAQGGVSSFTDADYQEAVILSSDLATEHGITCCRPSNSQFAAFVQAEEILQCMVNTTQPTYVSISHVLSGANLSVPITKGANDVLRVIYKYKLT